jgi:hypothetical protein
MTPAQALRKGIDPKQVEIKNIARKYGNHWIVFVPDESYSAGRRVLFEGGLVDTVLWRRDLERLADAA